MTPRPLLRGVVDTPILLQYRDAIADAVQFLRDLRLIGLLDISQWSALHVCAPAQTAHDQAMVEVFLLFCEVCHISAPISRRAGTLMGRLPRPIAFTPGDAIVAATALELKLPLYTLDPIRFAAVPKLTTLRPY